MSNENEKIILYGSCYGATKKYAEELSKRIGIEFVPFKKAKNLNNYKTIIYLGGLYAGGVLGLAKTFKKINDIADKNFIVVTVGMADPMNDKNATNIKNHIKRQIGKSIFEKAKIFHLRGRIDYSKLNFAHKVMMNLLYKKAKKLPQEKQTTEIKTMIETYNQKVDFIDFSALEKIAIEI